MIRTLIAQALLVLAFAAVMVAIWWGEHRWQFVVTSVLLFVAAGFASGATDNHNTKEEQ